MSLAAPYFNQQRVPSPVTPNPGRSLAIEVAGDQFHRLPIKTPVVTEETDLASLIIEYAKPLSRPGDVLFISEKVVAISQGRAIPESQIKIGISARILWRCVRKVPYGIGLRRPSSMQCAINECGLTRIWAAAIVGGVTRFFGRRGDFYRIAGVQAATIDAAGTSPLQPDRVILGPKDPEGTAKLLATKTGLAVAIVDVNDIGGSWVIGASPEVDKPTVENALADNPLGQNDECTPMGILRLHQAD